MKSLKSAWLRTIHLKGVSFRHVNYTTKLKKQNKKNKVFPGGPVAENLPCRAGDTGLIPGGELRSHMLCNSLAHSEHQRARTLWSPRAATKTR